MFIQPDHDCNVNGTPCTYFSGGDFGSCSDYEGCDCEIVFSESPEMGQRLLAGPRGAYVVVVYATNDAAKHSSSCLTNLEVTLD
mmetsp:Transcript_61854/g.93437  ORF Transcript_61854/g.93437 Transcript_61854/m.93437 type:complete len:84 (-) Transcript_61854:21-272(-)